MISHMEDILTHFMEDVAYFMHLLTSSHSMEDYSIAYGEILPHSMEMEDYFMDM